MTRASAEDQKLRLFYAEGNPVLYDKTTHLTLPDYAESHDILCELAHRHFAQCSIKEPLILDVGCGTGAETLRMLRRLPGARIVAVDRSANMLGGLRAKIEPDPTLHQRCHLVLADFLSEEFEPWSLCAESPWSASRFDAVISAFALHHHSLEAKCSVYGKFLRALQPGGLLLNLDIHGFQAPSLNRAAQSVTEDWIRRSFRDASNEDRRVITDAGADPDDLGADWLAHVIEQNLPLPIEGRGWSSTCGDAEADLEGEAPALRRAGFSEVACPYRNFQTAVIWARR